MNTYRLALLGFTTWGLTVIPVWFWADSQGGELRSVVLWTYIILPISFGWWSASVGFDRTKPHLFVTCCFAATIIAYIYKLTLWV